MSLRTTLGFGEPAEVEDLTQDELRRLRVQAARRVPAWREIEESALVHRPPSYLVDAESDELFTFYRVQIFTAGLAVPSFNESVPLVFFVRDNDELIFLEHAHPRTWSEVVERRARRGR